MRNRTNARAIILGIVVWACSGDGGSGGAGGAPSRDTLRIVVVTHGQASDPFWSVVANGVQDAGEELGVRVEYQAPTAFDMVRMGQLIEATVASRPHGLAVSVPDPDALGPAIRSAIESGITTVSLNSGDQSWKRLGLLGHVGQTEYEAGRAAGERLAAQGARQVLCVNHEVGNLALDLRCRGLGDGLEGAGATMRVLAVSLGDPEDATQRIKGGLARDPTVDGVLALSPTGAGAALAALRESGRPDRIAFGTFDLSPEVLLAVRDGQALFAIDQQPYLQGYLAVVMITKYLETRTIPGGGEIVRTGPHFVTRENAAEVITLSERGLR
jgi:simple sugar transport system substrate-binding protein